MNNGFPGSSINHGNGFTTTCQPNFNGPQPGHCIAHITNIRPEIAHLSSAHNMPMSFAEGERFIQRPHDPLSFRLDFHSEFKKDYDAFLNDVNKFSIELLTTRQEIESSIKKAKDQLSRYADAKNEALFEFTAKRELWEKSSKDEKRYGYFSYYPKNFLKERGQCFIDNFKRRLLSRDILLGKDLPKHRAILIDLANAKIRIDTVSDWGTENEAKLYQYIDDLNKNLDAIHAKENEISVARQQNLEKKEKIDKEEAAIREYQVKLEKHHEEKTRAQENMILALNNITVYPAESSNNDATDSLCSLGNSRNSPTSPATATKSTSQQTSPQNDITLASRGIGLNFPGPTMLLGDKIFHFNKKDITGPARQKTDDAEYEAALVQFKDGQEHAARFKEWLTAERAASQNALNAASEAVRERGRALESELALTLGQRALVFHSAGTEESSSPIVRNHQGTPITATAREFSHPVFRPKIASPYVTSPFDLPFSAKPRPETPHSAPSSSADSGHFHRQDVNNPITTNLNARSLQTINNVKKNSHQAAIDLAYTVGQGIGVLASGVDLVKGLKTAVEHPIETGKALYQLAKTDNKMDKLDEALAEKLNAIKLNQEKNTLLGALDAGFEKTKLQTDAVSAVLGAAGLANVGLNAAKTGIAIAKPIIETAVVPNPLSGLFMRKPPVSKGYLTYYERFTSVRIEETGMKWGGNIKKDQGQPFEDFVGPRFFPDSFQTPDTFKVYDYVDRTTGASVSVKTLNTLTESRLADPSQLFGITRGYINKILDFKEDAKPGFRWTADDVTSRELLLGVPAQTTPAQWEEISRAMLYGHENNVKVTIIKVE